MIQQQIAKFLQVYSLTPVGETLRPVAGHIATNFILNTVERGDILLRVYPRTDAAKSNVLEYGWQRAIFEARVLSFLGSQDPIVPRPITGPDNQHYAIVGDALAIVYPLLPGYPIDQSELSLSIARAVAGIQNRLMAISKEFPCVGSEPDGDVDYVLRILRNLRRRAGHEVAGVLNNLEAFLTDGGVATALERSPRGLVHGDFFFENVLHVGGAITGVVDFGDAYAGMLIMDVATGAMEFSVTPDEEFRAELFVAYLAGIRPWLLEHSVHFAMFYSALLVNCVRFAVHSLTLDLEAGTLLAPSQNRYVLRFLNFQAAKIALEKMFYQ
jgi:Ser/Thr protein kinase RdoA (MazF antagonist)